eukprot:TRINITY_DN709_c0_g1_i4.p1 TRINITY_DN709_c0_g1~~TRINITY_DN709_c0_g1_i4.p1  ORF type:complete len:286 (+),score=69.99 TRINITY_DN709_c0_g1_i4:704-1561(+)
MKINTALSFSNKLSKTRKQSTRLSHNRKYSSTNSPYRLTWLELQTSDMFASTAFLSEVLGWKPIDSEVGFYKRFTLDDDQCSEVAGIFQTSPENPSHPMVPNVQAMINTHSILDMTEIVKETGGQVLLEPMEVKSKGVTSIIADPEGAVFGLWEPKNYAGFMDVEDQHGKPLYLELSMHDIEKSADFYKVIFGFDIEDRGRGCYEFFYDGKPVGAGMKRMFSDWTMAQPTWNAYIEVDDLQSALVRTRARGGEILEEGKNHIGKLAVIRDPTKFIQLGLIEKLKN